MEIGVAANRTMHTAADLDPGAVQFVVACVEGDTAREQSGEGCCDSSVRHQIMVAQASVLTAVVQKVLHTHAQLRVYWLDRH